MFDPKSIITNARMGEIQDIPGLGSFEMKYFMGRAWPILRLNEALSEGCGYTKPGEPRQTTQTADFMFVAIKILAGELAKAAGQKVQVFGPESKRAPWWHLFDAEAKFEAETGEA